MVYMFVCLNCFPFPVAPRVVITPSSPQTVVVGDVLKLNCTATGLPTPTVQWFRNGVAVTPIALKSLQYSEIPALSQQNVIFTCTGINYADKHYACKHHR